MNGVEKFDKAPQKQADVNKTLAMDLVLCIDLSRSMKSALDYIKDNTRSAHDRLSERFKKKYHYSELCLRIRIIGFRDKFSDGESSFECSEFFNLPDEEAALLSFLDSLEAAGGGDTSESGLEALILATRSPWCDSPEPFVRTRHVIMFFSDSAVLSSEKAGAYPESMSSSLKELLARWDEEMDPVAKRLAVFAPCEYYPWSEIPDYFDNSVICLFRPHKGGEELYKESYFDTIF